MKPPTDIFLKTGLSLSTGFKITLKLIQGATTLKVLINCLFNFWLYLFHSMVDKKWHLSFLAQIQFVWCLGLYILSKVIKKSECHPMRAVSEKPSTCIDIMPFLKLHACPIFITSCSWTRTPWLHEDGMPGPSNVLYPRANSHKMSR